MHRSVHVADGVHVDLEGWPLLALGALGWGRSRHGLHWLVCRSDAAGRSHCLILLNANTRDLGIARNWAHAKHVILSEEFIDDVVLADNALELPRQAEVTDLDRAVLQDKQISRFDVAVHHVGRMDVLESAQEVKQNCFDVALCEEKLATIDLSQVGGRRLKDQVECLEGCWVRGLQDVVQLDNVAMVLEAAQKHYLSQLALGVGDICK